MKPGFLVLAIAFLVLPAAAQSQSIDRLPGMGRPLDCAQVISPAQGQPAAFTKSQADALSAYDAAVNSFRSILRERRAQIDSRQQLPNLPGQALYLARNNMMSAYRDVTAVVASR